jgi:GNAT superfamily N-acetyltransferase
VYVAEAGGRLVAFVHLHRAELFHAPGRLGRIMALAVAEGSRRQGIGRRLMAAVERRARECGCVKMEVSSGVHRPGAHAFYRKLGYNEEPKRFVKMLGNQK